MSSLGPRKDPGLRPDPVPPRFPAPHDGREASGSTVCQYPLTWKLCRRGIGVLADSAAAGGILCPLAKDDDPAASVRCEGLRRLFGMLRWLGGDGGGAFGADLIQAWRAFCCGETIAADMLWFLALRDE